jgi:hypothetical protein
MLGASQTGVRHSRRLVGLRKVTRQQWDTGHVWDDEIGVSTSLAPKFPISRFPTGHWCPKTSKTFWELVVTLDAMQARTRFCARFHNVGSLAKLLVLQPPSPRA